MFCLSPHFRAHTFQQHLPLRLFNLRSLFDIWAEQNTVARLTCHRHNVFSPFNRRVSSVAFRAIPFNPFHLYDINHWWCQFFSKHTLNSFFFKHLAQVYNTCTVLELFLKIYLALIHRREAKWGALWTDDRLCHTWYCQPPCKSAFPQKFCSPSSIVLNTSVRLHVSHWNITPCRAIVVLEMDERPKVPRLCMFWVYFSCVKMESLELGHKTDCVKSCISQSDMENGKNDPAQAEPLKL